MLAITNKLCVGCVGSLRTIKEKCVNILTTQITTGYFIIRTYIKIRKFIAKFIVFIHLLMKQFELVRCERVCVGASCDRCHNFQSVLSSTAAYTTVCVCVGAWERTSAYIVLHVVRVYTTTGFYCITLGFLHYFPLETAYMHNTLSDLCHSTVHWHRATECIAFALSFPPIPPELSILLYEHQQ